MRRKYKLYISLCLLLSLQVSYTYAQVSDTIKVSTDTAPDSVIADVDTTDKDPLDYQVRGIVLDKSTGKPVPFATINFVNSLMGTPAGLDGNFEFIFDDPPNDTIQVLAIGYKPYRKIITHGDRNIEMWVELEVDNNALQEVTVLAGEDPAILLMKKVIAKKRDNDPDKTDNYSYEAYNKMEIDLMNVSQDQFEKFPLPYLKDLSYIYKNIDSTNGQPFLPFFMTEALSDYYFQRKPRKAKELIKATQIKGIDNKSLNTYLGTMNVDINPYNNFLAFFDKKFVSPISNAGPTYYKYRLKDTTELGKYRIIELSYEPLRSGENCFSGTIRIVDSVFALQYVYALLPRDANINWVKDAEFYKEYAPVGDSLWFCSKEYLSAKLLPPGGIIKPPGFIARKTTSYKKIVINSDAIARLVDDPKFKANVIMADTAQEVTPEVWALLRHDTLSKNEKAIYNMFDELENDPQYSKFKNLMKVLVTGVVKYGPIEIGPYWNLYSYNFVEGNRFRFTIGTTPKLFKDVYLNGYVAYGTLDKRYKYSGSALWLLDRQPRSYLFASYTSDIDRTVNYYDKVSNDNIFSVAVRKKGIPQKLIFVRDARLEYYKEYYNGFSHMLTFLNKEYDPYNPLPAGDIFRDDEGMPSNSIINTEINLRVRYAYKEKFLEGNYYRTSLGSKYPIVELRYAAGLKGVLNSGYKYNKLIFAVSDNIKIAPYGSLYVNVFAGKYFGTLPYPLLETHPGNEFYTYNKYAFNMMLQYEFVSDQYAGFNIEHSLGGGLFTYIPGVKKLKLRQFWTAKGVIGSLSDENKALNLDKGFPFRTLQGNPYLELGTGIENILRLFRIDFVWRVAPKSLPTEPRDRYFGIFGSVKFAF